MRPLPNTGHTSHSNVRSIYLNNSRFHEAKCIRRIHHGPHFLSHGSQVDASIHSSLCSYAIAQFTLLLLHARALTIAQVAIWTLLNTKRNNNFNLFIALVFGSFHLTVVDEHLCPITCLMYIQNSNALVHSFCRQHSARVTLFHSWWSAVYLRPKMEYCPNKGALCHFTTH